MKWYEARRVKKSFKGVNFCTKVLTPKKRRQYKIFIVITIEQKIFEFLTKIARNFWQKFPFFWTNVQFLNKISMFSPKFRHRFLPSKSAKSDSFWGVKLQLDKTALVSVWTEKMTTLVNLNVLFQEKKSSKILANFFAGKATNFGQKTALFFTKTWLCVR